MGILLLDSEIVEIVVGSGGAVAGGAAGIIDSHTLVASGGALGGGGASIASVCTFVASGGAIAGGAATFTTGFVWVAAGGAIGGGEGLIESEYWEGIVRLIPFQASSDEAYVIEIGHEYLRFFTDAGDQCIVDDSMLDFDPTEDYFVGEYVKVGPYAILEFVDLTPGTNGYLYVSAPYAGTVAGITVECETAASDTLAVADEGGGLISIKLADTTASKNTGLAMQTLLRALGTVSGVDVSEWTVTEELNFHTYRPIVAAVAAVSLDQAQGFYICTAAMSGDTGYKTRSISYIKRQTSGTDRLVITSYAHGLKTGDVVTIDDVSGAMGANLNFDGGAEGSGLYWIVTVETADKFSLDDSLPATYPLTWATSYTTGGVATRATTNLTHHPEETAYWDAVTTNDVVEITTPYQAADVFDIDKEQNFNDIYFFHEDYPPMKLHYGGNKMQWSLSELNLTGGDVKYITKITESASSIRVYCTNHGLVDGDEVIIDDTEGSTALNGNTYTVSDATTKYFRLKDSGGSYVSPGGVGAWTGGGTVTKTKRLFYEDGEYPGCGAFHEQRLVVSGTSNNPQTVYGSAIKEADDDEYDSFVRDANDDSAAFEFTLVSEVPEKVRWMVSQDYLMIGTSGGVWRLGGSTTGDPLTQTNVSAKKQTNTGVGELEAVVTSDSVMFATHSLMKICRLAFDLGADKWVALDVTKVATHITKGDSLSESGVVQMDFQKEPLPIVWAVRADGQLIGMLYDAQEKIYAWFRVVTDGDYKSVAVISKDGEEDQVWAVAERIIGGVTVKYIERFQPHEFWGVLEDAYYVHCGVSYDGGSPVAITAITKANPAVVTAATHGFTNGDKVVITGVLGMTEVNIDLPATTYYTVANKTADTFELSGINSSAYTAYTSGGYVKEVMNTVSDLDHLEGETVTSLVDGYVHDDVVVAAGDAVLSWYGNQIHVGLPYTSTLEPMKTHVAHEYGTARGKKQRIHKMTLAFYETVGGQAGPDADDLMPISLDETYTETLFTDDLHFQFGGDWTDEATITVVQDEPLPMTVLALVPRVTLDED